MTYSNDPVRDAGDYMDKLLSESERLDKAEWELDRAFTAACAKGDANALMTWAPTVPDHSQMPPKSVTTLPRRWQTLAELMQEGVDYADANTELLQLVLNVAKNTPGTQDQAKRLIERMATAWAKQNVEAS
jgi:hypothetical protein